MTIRMIATMLVAAGLVLGSTACGKDGGGDAPKADAPKKADTSKIPLAEINKLGGEAVSFELQKVGKAGKGFIHVAAPKGWSNEGMMGFKPPKTPDLGFHTRFSPGTNCDGACQPKDWKTTAMKVSFGPFKGEKFTVVEEKALTNPEGHMLVVTSEGFGKKKANVIVARWKEGASRYMLCTANLDSAEAVAMHKAFALACETAIPEFLL